MKSLSHFVSLFCFSLNLFRVPTLLLSFLFQAFLRLHQTFRRFLLHASVFTSDKITSERRDKVLRLCLLTRVCVCDTSGSVFRRGSAAGLCIDIVVSVPKCFSLRGVDDFNPQAFVMAPRWRLQLHQEVLTSLKATFLQLLLNWAEWLSRPPP